MTTTRGWGRIAAATGLLIVLAGLTGCEDGFDGAGGSPVGDPDAVGGVVAKARPEGAAFGRLRHSDGTVVVDGAVDTTQPANADAADTAAIFLTFGLACLADTEGEVCPETHGATLTDAGLWHADAEDVDDAKEVTAIGYGPTDRPALSAASTSVTVDAGSAPRRVPDLVLWEPDLTVASTDRGLEVSWAGGGAVPHGPTATFDVYLQDPGDFADSPELVVEGATGTSVTVPGWRAEDRPVQVSVVATTETSRAAYVYTTEQVRVAGGPVPLSRGKACLLDRDGALVESRTGRRGCGLTDGNLTDRVQVRLPGECDTDRPSCMGTSHPRVCVDLGSVQPVELAVVRTPFVSGDDTVETSVDGRSFTRQGTFGEPEGDVTSEVYAVPLAGEARWVCSRSPFGYSGDSLAEISVW